MIIQHEEKIGTCDTVGELIDALQKVDKNLCLNIGCQDRIELYHVKCTTEPGEQYEKTEWIELEY